MGMKIKFLRFFSFVQDIEGNIYYFDKEQRLTMPIDDPNNAEIFDSHSDICAYHGLDEDKVNKYEFLRELELKDTVFEPTAEHKSKLDYFLKNLDLKDLVVNSYYAYQYCSRLTDDPEIRKMIIDSDDAYMYCYIVNDDPEVRKYITEPSDSYKYCKYINDDPEVRKYITDSAWACFYCTEVNDDPGVRQNITEPRWAWRYCVEVKDDPVLKDIYEKELARLESCKK